MRLSRGGSSCYPIPAAPPASGSSCFASLHAAYSDLSLRSFLLLAPLLLHLLALAAAAPLVLCPTCFCSGLAVPFPAVFYRPFLLLPWCCLPLLLLLCFPHPAAAPPAALPAAAPLAAPFCCASLCCSLIAAAQPAASDLSCLPPTLLLLPPLPFLLLSLFLAPPASLPAAALSHSVLLRGCFSLAASTLACPHLLLSHLAALPARSSCCLPASCFLLLPLSWLLLLLPFLAAG
eukprot:gene28901-32094_t